MNAANYPRQLSIGSYKANMTTREEDYNIDKLYKLHLIYKIKISINRVSIKKNAEI